MYPLTELLRRQDNLYQRFTLKHGARVVSLRTMETDCHVLPEVKEHTEPCCLISFSIYWRNSRRKCAPSSIFNKRRHASSKKVKTEALHTLGELARAFAAREMNCGEESRRSSTFTNFLETLDALVLATNLHSVALLDVVQALEQSLDGTWQ